MNSTDSTNPVSQQDVAVLIGIVAIIEGHLLGGELDEQITHKLAERFHRTGLLATGPDGQLPTNGKLRLALEDLVQRLRYAYGDHDTPLTPTPEATAHVLGFPTEAAANDCRGALTRDAQSLLIRPRGARGWQLYAIYPELPPDQGFHERKRQLGQIAARFGGTYDGSQDPPR